MMQLSQEMQGSYTGMILGADIMQVNIYITMTAYNIIKILITTYISLKINAGKSTGPENYTTIQFRG